MDTETVAKNIDLTQPVAVYHIGTLRHVSNKHDLAGMIAAYMDAVPSGSYLALAHLQKPGPDHELAWLPEGIAHVFRAARLGGYPRTYDEIATMLSGLEILDPGLVTLADWWPDGPRDRPLGLAQ